MKRCNFYNVRFTLIIITIINVLTVIGLWRIFYYAVRLGSVTVVPDFTMSLESTLVFPMVLFLNFMVVFVVVFGENVKDRK